MNITIEGMLGDPNVKVTPLFPDEDSYRAFRERYVEAVYPELKRLERARALSLRDSVFRILR